MNIEESKTDLNILSSLSPEIREDLDHSITNKGYSYDSIENAFEYLEEKEKIEFSNAIQKFSEAITQNDKDEALDIIVKIIE